MAPHTNAPLTQPLAPLAASPAPPSPAHLSDQPSLSSAHSLSDSLHPPYPEYLLHQAVTFCSSTSFPFSPPLQVSPIPREVPRSSSPSPIQGVEPGAVSMCYHVDMFSDMRYLSPAHAARSLSALLSVHRASELWEGRIDTGQCTQLKR